VAFYSGQVSPGPARSIQIYIAESDLQSCFKQEASDYPHGFRFSQAAIYTPSQFGSRVDNPGGQEQTSWTKPNQIKKEKE
jgi:hypothetical protein